MNGRRGGLVLALLVWGYVAVIVLLPVVALVQGALAQGPLALARALLTADALGALGRTVAIAVAVTLIHAVGGLAVAWVLVRQRPRWGRWVDALLDLPLTLSAVVVGYGLLLLFGRRGPLAGALAGLGWRIVFDWPGMVLATLLVTLPFMTRALQPVLAALEREQEEAALTLGAGRWEMFWRVIFPSLRWGLISGGMLTLTRALGEFGAVLVVGGGVQGHTETATLFIFRALDEREYIAAYGMALVLGLLALALMAGAAALRRRVRYTA